jgi:ketosteroid isomerase-like protein
VTWTTALVDRFIDALARYDVDALGPMLTDDFVRWLNLGGDEQGRDALLAVIAVERDHVRRSEVEVRHRVATDEGFVLQLTIRGTTTGGAPFDIPVCLVVTVDGERIRRIDEYASSDQVRPLLREMLGT